MRTKPVRTPTVATMRNAMAARVTTRGHGARLKRPKIETMTEAVAEQARVRRTRKRRTLDALRLIIARHDGVGARLRRGRLRLLAQHAARERVDAGGRGRIGIGREEGLLALHRLRDRLVGQDAAPVLDVEIEEPL